MTQHQKLHTLAPKSRDKKNGHRSASIWANDDHFRMIFDSVNDGIFISDAVTGRFIEINKAGQAMFGYSLDELLGSDIGAVSSGVHPYTGQVAREKRLKTAPGISRLFEWHCRAKDGKLLWAEVSTRPVKIGDVACIISTVRDISERKRLNGELVHAQAAAAAANNAKSAFLATMSHELRTPLNAIMGFSDLMQSQPEGLFDLARFRDYAGDIHRSGAHLLALINEVLDLSRIDAGKAPLSDDDVSLAHVVDDAGRMIAALAEQGHVTLEAELTGNLPHLRADERRITQVVLNLLSNAVKFTPPGGKVTVTAAQTADGISLTVRDTGIGIAAQDIAVVLERFGQVDSHLSRKHSGTGLGLPIAQQLVEMHGGTLTVESALGVGTAITAHFPASRIRPDRAAA
jgi:PAS domain S-box-containing protein